MSVLIEGTSNGEEGVGSGTKANVRPSLRPISTLPVGEILVEGEAGGG
jgi:hypothetical protein